MYLETCSFPMGLGVYTTICKPYSWLLWRLNQYLPQGTEQDVSHVGKKQACSAPFGLYFCINWYCRRKVYWSNRQWTYSEYLFYWLFWNWFHWKYFFLWINKKILLCCMGACTHLLPWNRTKLITKQTKSSMLVMEGELTDFLCVVFTNQGHTTSK